MGMLIHSKLTLAILSILEFTLIVQLNLLSNELIFADPNIASTSSPFVKKSNRSLVTGNGQDTNPNTTKVIESLAKNQKNFYNFVAVGDWGCTNNTDKTVRNIKARNPDLVVALGDYSYDTTPGCWIKRVAPLHMVMKIAIGNHDNPANEYLKYFKLSEQYYSFDLGNIHFIIMSTEPTVPFQKGSSQYNFVKSDLERISKNPNIKWIIVANHRTTYPAGLNGSVAGNIEDNRIGMQFRDIYHPLFDQYRVDLVLQGHVHNYQRTFPLKYNIAKPIAPKITDSHKNYYVNPSGELFLTVGTAGAPLVNAFPPKQGNYNAYEDSAYGILYIKVLKDGSLLEGTFYNENGIGQPIPEDTFSIKKAPNLMP